MANNQIRVAWLSGNRAKRRELLDKMKSQIGPHEEVRIGDGESFSALESHVLGGDCFGTMKLVVVEAVPVHPGSRQTLVNDMRKLMDRVPDGCLLVFSGMDASDQRALSSHAAKVGKLFQFDDEVNADRAATLISEWLLAADKKIDIEDAHRLVKLMPSREREREQVYLVDQLRLTVEKLIAFTDSRKVVKTEDVLLVTPNHATATSWVFYDAIDAKDFDRAYALLQKLLVAEGDPFEGVKLTLSGLLWRFRLLLVLKEAGSPAEATQNAAAIKKLVQEGSGMAMRFRPEGQQYSDAMIGRTLGTYGPSPLLKYTLKRLVSITEALEQAVEHLRYASSLSEHLLLVESVLMLACEKIADSTRRKLAEYFDECGET